MSIVTEWVTVIHFETQHNTLWKPHNNHRIVFVNASYVSKTCIRLQIGPNTCDHTQNKAQINDYEKLALASMLLRSSGGDWAPLHHCENWSAKETLQRHMKSSTIMFRRRLGSSLWCTKVKAVFFFTSGWRIGTHPASFSNSSRASAILLLDRAEHHGKNSQRTINRARAHERDSTNILTFFWDADSQFYSFRNLEM